MKKYLILLVLIIAVFLTGCNSPEKSINSEIDLEIMEMEDYLEISPHILNESLTEEDFSTVEGLIRGDVNSRIDFGYVNYDDRNLLAVTDLALEGPNLMVPTVQFTSEYWHSFYAAFTNKDVLNSKAVDWLFHWTNHFEVRKALTVNGTLLNQIVQGAIREGDVYKLASSAGAQTRYMFVSRISISGGASRPWVAFLSESGAPITGFDYGTKNGTPRAGEAAKYLAKQIAKGAVKINPNELPKGIRNNWQTNSTPPVIRYWWWALSYQVKIYAEIAKLTVTAAAKNLMQWSLGPVDVGTFMLIPEGLLDSKENFYDFYLGPASSNS